MFRHVFGADRASALQLPVPMSRAASGQAEVAKVQKPLLIIAEDVDGEAFCDFARVSSTSDFTSRGPAGLVDAHCEQAAGRPQGSLGCDVKLPHRGLFARLR